MEWSSFTYSKRFILHVLKKLCSINIYFKKYYDAKHLTYFIDKIKALFKNL